LLSDKNAIADLSLAKLKEWMDVNA